MPARPSAAVPEHSPRDDLPSQPRAYPRRDNVQDPSTVEPARPERQPAGRPLSTPPGVSLR